MFNLLKNIIPFKLKIILFAIIACATVHGNRIRYDNYAVYEINSKNLIELNFVENLMTIIDSAQILHYDRVPNMVKYSINDTQQNKNEINSIIYTIVGSNDQDNFMKSLNTKNILYNLIENNLQDILDEDYIRNQQLKMLKMYNRNYGWDEYHTLEETYDWMEQLSEDYNGTVELIRGGRTYEGRDIMGVKVSYKTGNKGIFVEGGIHAREWISPATVTYILNELLTNDDTNVRKIAENYDWYIFPHFNPDGYVYTHTTDRLWRKTRSRNFPCYGVDPNRNWDFYWRYIGASSRSCSQTFAGRSAFSEIETRTMAKYIKSINNDDLRVYLSFHSFSQLLLLPYGHTNERSKNHNDLQQIGMIAAKALSKRYGTTYKVGTSYEIIYPVSGTSSDWAFDVLGIPISYTYELRPADRWNGFLLPANEIIPTGEETLDSVVALINESERLGYLD